MSQLTINIMCLLYDENIFSSYHNRLNDTWLHQRGCLQKSEFQNPSEQLLNDSDTVRFAFIRDPIQRFVSLYIDKCVQMCNFEKDLEKWDLLMMGSDFEERKSPILKQANILKRQGVNETTVEKIHKETLVGETDHSTHKSSHRQEAERQIREDPYIRDLLHKIYFFDYLIFPFKRDLLDQKYQTSTWKLPEKST